MSPARDYYLPERRLVSQEDAAHIENSQIPRSKFTGAWTRKTTFDAGYLVPFLLNEILPGDSMKYEVTAYVRMSTPLFPIFDEQRVDTFFFFVPNRILWTNWARFMGEQDNPTDSIAFTPPRAGAPNGGHALGSLQDHFGLPTVGGPVPGGSGYTYQSMPLRAYNLIYNTWFRDENVIPSAFFDAAAANDSSSNFVLRRRAKSKDYFTSALPWAQKFTPPNVPVAGQAPIIGLGVQNNVPIVGPVAVYDTQSLGTAPVLYPEYYNTTNQINILSQGAGATAYPAIYADLAAATGVAINTFRQAWMIQSLLEKDARGGTRYTEKIRTHFGVINPDFRLQRPEYIGGGQTQLMITPIAQTAPTAGVPLGALGGTGTAAGSHRASYAATEHGWIIGLINVKSELSYQYGIHKMWDRLTQYDYYFPSFAGLGEQAILRRELYANGLTDDSIVFGYQERWQEYRTQYSEVTGKFRGYAVGTLDAWHLAQRFTAPPTLSQTFLEDNPDMVRILAAAAASLNQQYLADILIRRTAVRPIPMFGTPALLGRF